MAAKKNNRYNEKYSTEYFKKTLQKGIKQAEKNKSFYFIKDFHRLVNKPNNWYWLQLMRHKENPEIIELSKKLRTLLDKNFQKFVDLYQRP